MNRNVNLRGRRNAPATLLSLGGLGPASAGLGVWLSGRSRCPVDRQVPDFERRAGVALDSNLLDRPSWQVGIWRFWLD